MLDGVALGLANEQELLSANGALGELGVIGDDDVGRRPAGSFGNKASAAADTGENADSAEADGLDLGDAKGLVDALSELDVGAFADVHELHIGGHAIAAGTLIKAELVYEDDADIAVAGIKFLHAFVIFGLAAGKIGQAFTMYHGPTVVIFHPSDVVAAAGRHLGGEGEHNGGLASFAEHGLEVFENAQVAPHALGRNKPRDVGEDIVRLELQQCAAVGAQLLAAGHLVLGSDAPVGNAVVGDLRFHRGKVRREKLDLFLHVIADAENAIAVAGGLDQSVPVIVGLIPEDVLDIMPGGDCRAHYVIEHGVMAGMMLDQTAHGRDFVGVKDGAELRAPGVHDGGEGRGHAHVFMRKDDARLGLGADTE